MAETTSTSVVIPAFNEAAVIGQVVTALKTAASWHEVIVVDDGSNDDTSARAREAGATVITHPYNKGNGAAVKTGLRHASGDFILISDGDGQHAALNGVRLVEMLGDYDLVVGARSGASQATTGRRIGNRILNGLATYLSGRPIPDLTSGLRAARREHLLEFIHLLPNGFSTPTTTTLSFIKAGYNVAFEPAEATPREGQSKIRLAPDGVKFFLILLRVVTLFSPLRIFVPVSLVALALGVGYAAWTIATQMHVTNSSVMLVVLGVIIFLIGLVSDQIAALRFERRR
ncbi:MAG: glycosyltransferase family 2 protein [Vicinamibacterales bacterium]|jgi:glycosyltransferase involved in cell wall biosynthesis|nr:glycosyltransferase family 2 protein [Vicinamibacterales bacterium]